ncbi:MAG: hypothetical protein WDO68_02955 [Gammaproteobacteria bacterium]
MSTVHVNRTLMELRRSGQITLRDKHLTIHHLPALEAAAGLPPATCTSKRAWTKMSLPGT